MTDQLRIECLTRAPICRGNELRWIEAGSVETLPANIARILIEHGLAREIVGDV